MKAIQRFSRFRGTTLAAASSFYFLLTVVPMVLLLARALGFVFGDLNSVLDRLFIVATSLFPGFTTEVLLALKGIVRAALFGPAQLTLVNIIFLLISSLTFVNSLWTGIYLMTQDRHFLSWHNYVRGLVLLAVSSIFVTGLFLLPSLYAHAMRLLQKSNVMDFLGDIIPASRLLFQEISSANFDQNFLLKSDFLALIFLVIYFTFGFRWLFKGKLKTKDALVVGGAFSLALFLLRRLFGLYLETMKESLLSSYGHSYTVLVSILWVYIAMCAFFVMVALGTELLERRRGLEGQLTQGYDKLAGQGDSFDSSAD